MSLTVTSPVTGGAQTGFTTPAFTLAVDTAPTSAGKQYAVTGKTGTLPASVDALSTPSRPFTATLQRAQVLKTLQPVDPVTGVLRSVPRNTYKVIVRKGVTPLAGQASVVCNLTLTMDIPAGSDSADPDNVRAALSLLVGVCNQISSSMGDTLVTGVI